MICGDFLSVCGEAMVNPALVAEDLWEAGRDPRTMTVDELRAFVAENY